MHADDDWLRHVPNGTAPNKPDKVFGPEGAEYVGGSDANPPREIFHVVRVAPRAVFTWSVAPAETVPRDYGSMKIK